MMPRAPVLAMALLLPGCSGSPSCRISRPPPEAHLVTVSVVDGRVRSRTALPYFVGTRVEGGVLSIVPPGGTPRPVATVDPPVATFRSPLSRDGSTLVGPGPSRWRLPGAAGRHLTTVGGTAVILGADNQLRGIRLSDGRPLWNTRLDHDLFTKVVAVDGARVLAAASPAPGPDDTGQPDNVHAVDARTGRLLWTQAAPPRRTVRHLRVVGALLVAALDADDIDETAELRGLRTATGALAWSATLPHDRIESMDLAAAELVVTNADGILGCA